MLWPHVAAAALSAWSLFLVLWAQRRTGGPHWYLAWAAVGIVVWCATVASFEVEGLQRWHQLLWLPGSGFTCGAFLLWASAVGVYGWRPSRPLVAMWIAEPLLVVAVRIVFGTGSIVHLEDTAVVFGPLFIAHTAYCFGLLIVVVMRVARRRTDRSPAVRGATYIMFAAATGALVSEALRLQLTDIVVSVALALLAVLVFRAGDDFSPRPDPDALLDDLGALAFVFDSTQRLVDLNAPARMFYALRGETVPTTGTPAAELLGVGLTSHAQPLSELSAGPARVRMSGYVHRLSAHGSPSRGWVALLRRSAPSAADARSANRRRWGRLLAYDPESGLLTERSLRRLLAQTAAEADVADTPVLVAASHADVDAAPEPALDLAEEWSTRDEAVAAGRIGRSTVAVVLRAETIPREELIARVKAGPAGVSREGAAGGADGTGGARVDVIETTLAEAVEALDRIATRVGRPDG